MDIANFLRERFIEIAQERAMNKTPFMIKYLCRNPFEAPFRFREKYESDFARNQPTRERRISNFIACPLPKKALRKDSRNLLNYLHKISSSQIG
jgi:hypothetical protein